MAKLFSHTLDLSEVFVLDRSCVSKIMEPDDKPYEVEEVYTNDEDAYCKAIELMANAFMEEYDKSKGDKSEGAESLRSNLIDIMLDIDIYTMKRRYEEVQEAIKEAYPTVDSLWIYTVRGIKNFRYEVDEDDLIGLTLDHLETTINRKIQGDEIKEDENQRSIRCRRRQFE